jgi:hypothetical protein
VVFTRPIYMQPSGGDAAISYTAQQDRNALVRALISREGILDYDSVAPIVRQRAAGANASIDIAPFRGAINGDDVANQGTYIVVNDATLNWTTGIPAPPGSGTRRHRVTIQVRDKMHNGSWTTYDAVPVILADTGSGTPAQPNSAITIGYINQGVGQTSITTAMIELAATRATVGSVDLSGTFNIHADLGTVDGTRPLKWQVNADGRVMLSGWRMRSAGSVTYAFNTLYAVTAHPDVTRILPVECRPSGIRDFVVASYNGPVHMAVHPDGQIFVRYVAAADSFAGTWWVSFEGSYLK